MNLRQAALALAALAGATPLSARAGTIWTAVASEKVRPDAAARSTRDVAIAAAKNEFEAFQVVVTGAAKGVSATASDLTGPGKISGVKLFREALVNLKQPSAADGGTGLYPDPLVPDVDDVVGEKRNAFPFDVPDGQSLAIWVDVHVPQDAPAGTYHGTVTVHADGTDTAVPVTLLVWDFALPSTASLKSAFGMGWVVAKMHNVQAGDAGSKLRARYAQLALDHRVSLDTVWDDELANDWTRFDTYYGPLLDGTAPTQLKGAKLTSTSAGANSTSTSELADWAAHFKSHGWFDRLFQYTCDEPPITCQWSDIPARAQAAKAADPGFRTLVTTDLSDATTNNVLGSIDLLTPVVNQMDDRATSWTTPGDQRSTYDAFLASSPSKELWEYESCMSHGCGGTVDMGNPSADQVYFTGWPSYVVDASSVRARALEWFSFRWGMKGELYFETVQAYYSRDPWTDGVFDFNGNGDGTLFYPGTPAHIGGQTDIPVASIRLKMIREGMEDFEYLKLMSDLGDAAGAKAIAQQLFPHPYQSDVNPADLMAARQNIAHRILALMGKPIPASVTTVPGAPASSMLVSGTGGGCGSTGHRSGLLTMVLVPLALVGHRLRRRRRA